ncbi:MAG: cadherin-like beta sandwich domain-containing protein, partial [Luteolibacter sp.]
KVTAAGGLWSKTYRTRVSTIPVVAGTGYGEIPDGLSGFPSPGAPRDITFTVSGRTGAITDVLVEFTLQPAHAYCSDVAVVLIAPDSTQHTVCALSHLDDDSRMAGPYLFSDAAAVPFSLAVTAAGGNVDVPSGSYRTQNDSDTATSLAAFFASKAPNGTWTLRFTDRYAGDTGSVSAANLYIATASDDANLSALTLSSAVLAPTFNANTAAYSANVPNATASIMVTPTVAQAGATVKVNSVTVASGSASAPLALNVGSNTITVLVTAQNGTTTKSYTLTVTRAIPPGGGEIIGTNLGQIPNETPTGRDIYFEVAGGTNLVTGVSVRFTLNPAHSFASDLSVRLIAPDGTTAQVFRLDIDADDNSDLGGPYLFEDSAATFLSVAAAAVGDSLVPAGSYRAENVGTQVVLNTVFGGKFPDGTWKLRFIDAYFDDTGTVSDARLNLTTGSPPDAQLKISIVRQSDGSRLLILSGALPNASYHLQRSNNLTAWPNLTTVTTSSAGIAIYTDTTAAAPSYFYRFVSVSP